MTTLEIKLEIKLLQSTALRLITNGIKNHSLPYENVNIKLEKLDSETTNITVEDEYINTFTDWLDKENIEWKLV